jgi:sec-independent protein translocase protein TatA
VSSPGATELLIVLVIVLLILGPKRLPALGRQLGGGLREFRRSIGGDDDTASSDDDARTRSPVTGRGDSATRGIDSERRAD